MSAEHVAEVSIRLGRMKSLLVPLFDGEGLTAKLAGSGRRRVLRLRMLAVKNSMKRSRAPAAAMRVGEPFAAMPTSWFLNCGLAPTLPHDATPL
jgi:hypothetical protein